MKGSAKFLLAALMLVFLLSTIAESQEIYALPVVKELKAGHSVVRYDKVVYHFKTTEEISVTFESIDDRYVELFIKQTDDIRLPYLEVNLWWDDFPINTLMLGIGGDNSWIVDSETGYAEK
jgi:hypothetical protein